jgi:hypothetical protein
VILKVAKMFRALMEMMEIVCSKLCGKLLKIVLQKELDHL